MRLKASVFDLDHTLVRVNMSVAFGRYLYKSGVIRTYPVIKSILIYLCHKKLGKSLNWLHQQTFKVLFKDFPKLLLTSYVEQFLEAHLDQLFYLPSKEALLTAQKEGELTALLSSSPDFIVEPLAKRLNIPYWMGTTYAVNERDELSEVTQILDGDSKAEFLRQLLAHSEIDHVTVYTDSILDLPILLEADSKVVVRPDNKLLSLSKLNRWKMI